MNSGLLALALLVGSLALCDASAGAASPALTGARVVSVENGGLLFTDNPAGVSGCDAAYSLPLGERTLWLFGDVFLLSPSAPERHYVGAVSNCALLVPRGSGVGPLRRYAFLTDAETGLARQVIRNEPDEGTEVRLWPLGGWCDRQRRQAYLYYGIVKTTGGGPLAFETVGHGLSRADVSTPDALEFSRLKAPDGEWPWWRAAGGALFGSAVIAGVPGDHLYVVGYREADGGKLGTLARVPRSRIAERDAYEYLARAAPHAQWTTEQRDAAAVHGLNDFPAELSVAYNAYLGGYLAVHSVGISDRIRLSLAPEPWGPYEMIGEIGAPRPAFSDAFCYAGKEHPELAEHNGRVIYVTYVDSQRYWPQLLKVTLEKGR